MLGHLIVGRAALGADRVDLDKAARLNCLIGTWFAAFSGDSAHAGAPPAQHAPMQTDGAGSNRVIPINGGSASARVVDLHPERRPETRHRHAVGAPRRRDADIVNLHHD